ncbi:uncharacterized protein LOC113855556 [Abrus precatorius]|uniref:Uncharacterized protein LOC113855556 n=1 Tax=Abrus precatorius TaxID=3816 RepID=A0A8B8KGV9_ABRPR|nr:uncharacterized protein LOC113855556 [Abrus precatorius]
MAFFSYVSSVIVLLFVLNLSSPLFIHEAKNLVVANTNLIQSLCNYSETPQTCNKCVQSCNASEKADGVQIATIILNCIKDEATTLALNVTNLASISDGDLKTLCQTCAKDYGYSIPKEIDSAKQSLQIQQYEKAESFVVSALDIDIDCQKKLKSFGPNKVPSDIFNVTTAYEELSEAACRIIEKL